MKNVGLLGYSSNLGGAGRALGRWEKTLRLSRHLEVETYYFADYYQTQKSLRSISDKKISVKSNQIQCSIGRKMDITDGGNLSLNIIPTFFGKNIRKSKVDVFNIHWVQGEMLSINQLSLLPQKVIWTLHDPWLINGIGHYGQDSLSGMLGAFQKFLNSWTQLRKQNILRRDDYFITPSKWLEREFLNFGIPQDKVCTIANPLPFETFFPIDKELARHKLGLPMQKFLILFGADSPASDKRKGFTYGIDLLNYAARFLDFELVTFGHNSLQNQVDFSVRHLGYISNDEKLNLIYNSCDLTLLPSRIDNLPQVMTESISCGTPVFALPNGGPTEVLSNGIGYLARSNDFNLAAIDFLACINNVKNSRRNKQELHNFAKSAWNEELILKSFEKIVETASG